MKAGIISIGNELLNGRTVNTNATFISDVLQKIGVSTKLTLTITDEPDAIASAITHMYKQVDAIIITGGLGPTSDDITLDAVAKHFGVPLVYKPEIEENIREKYQERGKTAPDTTKKMAMFPETASTIPNRLGTALGAYFSLNNRQIFCLPGVPKEMQSMMSESVVEILAKSPDRQEITVHFYRTAGIAESRVFQLCQSLFHEYSQFQVAYLPKFGGVDIRISYPEGVFSEADYQTFENTFYKLLGKFIYTKGEKNLAETVGEILLKNNAVLAIAESCTGGLVQNYLTNIPGSSAFFNGGIVTYSNTAKSKFLNVPKDLLVKHGAVSEAVAIQMAQSIKAQFDATIGLSITGIAGPDGGTTEKPVGLVYIGIATKTKCYAQKFLFGKDRLINKERAAQTALDTVRRALLGL